jgi:hypothetical protein
VTGNVVIWGHGNYSDAIGNDNGKKESLRSKQLATVLQSSGLPAHFDGNLVTWSCWGGVPGGLAQALFLSLKNRGYDRLKVWGPVLATGRMSNCYFVVYSNLQFKVVGDDDVHPFGTGMNAVGDMSDKRDATHDDMRCYG